MKAPTSCRTRSMRGSARSRRRSPPSRIGRCAMIRPRSRVPASSSASTPTGISPSIAAMSDRRTSRRCQSAAKRSAGVENGEPDETAPAAPVAPRTVITIGGAEPEDDDDDDAIKPLPDRLVSELTAHRTLALRDAVANNPQVALTALLHKLCLDTFQHSAAGACLEASVRHVFFPVQAADLKDSPSAKAVAERHEAWKADLPKDEAALWDWLAALDETRRAALLAHCVSFGVNALYEKGDRYGGPGISAHGVQAPHRPGRPPRPRRRSRHGGGRLAADGRQLSRPRHQAPHPRSRAGGQGRAGRAAHRPPQEGGHGEGGRTAARRHGLAARAAASR